MTEFPKDVAAQLEAIEKMSASDLRALWRSVFGRPHPGWVQKEFLVRGLGYHLQEKAFGGLSAALRRRLLSYAEELRLEGRIASLARPRIKPGTRLVRSWGGQTHVVTVLDTAFEYRGKRFGSLSEIARAITKTRWSGPAFFGLRTATSPKPRPT
jgi:hypothetical protein